MNNSPLFIQLLERLLNQKLQKFKHKDLNSDTVDELYFVIKEAVFDHDNFLQTLLFLHILIIPTHSFRIITITKVKNLHQNFSIS